MAFVANPFVRPSLQGGNVAKEQYTSSFRRCTSRRVRVSQWQQCASKPATSAAPALVRNEPLQRAFETYNWRGHKVNYLEEGEADGDPVMIIHGFGASINHWRKNIPALTATNALRVFAIDLIGFGASAKPGPEKITYSIELWTDLVCDLIASLNVGRSWAFLGNSIGSLVCLAVADRLGEGMVRGCALINCAGGMVSFRYSELGFFQRLIFRSFNGILFNGVVGPRVFNYIREKKNLGEVLKQVYPDETAVSEELVDILAIPAQDAGACEVFLAILNGEPGPSPEELLKRLTWCPVLAIWGEKDPWTPLSGGFHPGSSFPQYHDGLILETIPNAGHCVHDECPQVVNELLVPFLLSPRLKEAS